MEKVSKDEIIRAEILKGGQKLFQQYGLNKTTMEDIAKSIGKGKSTLYYYYKSKEEIFYEVVEMEMQHVFDATEKAVNAAPTASEKFKAYAITKIKESKIRRNLYNVVQTSFDDDLQLVCRLRRKYDTRAFNMVRNILESSAKHNECVALKDDELDLMANVIVSALRGIETDLILDEKFSPLEARFEAVINVLFNGIRAC